MDLLGGMEPEQIAAVAEATRVVLWQATARRVNYLRAELARDDVRRVRPLHAALRRELAILLDGADLSGRGDRRP